MSEAKPHAPQIGPPQHVGKPSKARMRVAFLEEVAQDCPIVAVDVAGLRLFVPTAGHTADRPLFGKRRSQSVAALRVATAELQRFRLPAARFGTFLDVAARTGVVAVHAVARGPFASAIALDPNPDNVRLIELNAAANEVGERVTTCAAELGEPAPERPYEAPLVVATAPIGNGVPPVHLVSRGGIIDHLTAHDVAVEDVGLVWLDTGATAVEGVSACAAVFAAGVPAVVRLSQEDVATEEARNGLRDALADGALRFMDVGADRDQRTGLRSPEVVGDVLSRYATGHLGTYLLLLPPAP